MRSILSTCLVLAVAACGSTKGGGDGDGGNTNPDACAGLECQVVDCNAMGQPPTTLTGTVYAPNGTLPLNGVNVYVPREPLPPFNEGAECTRCETSLPGSPIAQAVSDAEGKFRIENVPVGADIPLVITTGKWRRVVTLPNVSQCEDNALGMADTRLPKNKAEGDIPKIAITTGNADTMECLARKLGIEDAEITNNAGAGRIHLYAGNGVSTFKNGYAGGSGQTISGAQPFWESLDTLKQYDIVILSCEGSQRPATKPQMALDNMKAYADVGGRVFASHWHNIWIGGNFTGNPSLAPAVWPAIGIDWGSQGNFQTGIDVIDQISNPKGSLFAQWMTFVGGSPTTPGELPVTEFRVTVDDIDPAKAERWVYTKGGGNVPADKPQMFQFTTPNEVASDQRCGKVVFTDMHVSGQSQSGGNPYPDNCVGGANNLALTPQEKALAFMFFDIAGCVGQIF